MYGIRKFIRKNRYLKHFIIWVFYFLFSFFFFFSFISWRLITLQYCSGFCHPLTWISHGFTCVPHPDPPSRLPPRPIPLGLPSAPALSTCLMDPTWAGGIFCFLSDTEDTGTLIFFSVNFFAFSLFSIEGQLL